MNCWKGICVYRTDNTNLCLQDKLKGEKPKPCDMHGNVQTGHECRHGYVDCKQCYAYFFCNET